MAQKIVGLDIGNYSIKAVVLESTYRGWELIGYHETRQNSEYVEAAMMIEKPDGAPEDSESEQASELMAGDETLSDGEPAEADAGDGDAAAETFDPQKERLRLMVQHFIKRYGADWDSMFTAFHGDTLSIKILSLPFPDQKKIDEILPFTLEDMVPFSLRDKIVDYQMLTREPGNTRLLVGILDRNHMADYLHNFEGTGKEPKGVILDALALGNVYEQLADDEQKQGVTAILDLGHRTTSATILEDGHIAWARTFPQGGQDLTQAIADEFDMDFEDAERTKHNDGFLPSEAIIPESDDAKAMARAMGDAFARTVTQIRLTFQSYVAESKRQVDRVLLVGGGSRLKNIDNYLSEQLEKPTERFHYLRNEFDRLPESADVEPVMTAGLGMAFSGLSGGRLKRLNFRKGPFAFKGDYEYWKGRFAHIALSATFIFAAFMLSIWTQFFVLDNKSEGMSTAIASTCKEILDKDISDAKICMSQMIEVIGNQNTGGTKLKPATSIIKLFDELASRMTGEGMSVELDELEIKPDKLKVKGQVDSIATVGTIVNNLREYGCFTDINQGPTRATVRGDKIEFSLSILVDCSKMKEEAPKATEKATAEDDGTPDETGEDTADGAPAAPKAPADGPAEAAKEAP